MTILLAVHSIVRWLLVAVAGVAIILLAIGWLGKKKFSKTDRILVAAYSGLLDLQVLIGLIFLLWTGFAGAGFPRFRLEHMTIMFIAALMAHFNSRWKEADDKIRYRNTLFTLLGSLLLIFLGVALLPGGWSR